MADFYWTKDIKEAKKEQWNLVDLVKTTKETFNVNNFKKGLAIGTAYEKNTKTAFAVCIAFNRSGKLIGDFVSAKVEVDFPYVPGLLAFRVGPAVCSVLDNISDDFDLYLFDGQGIAHPDGFGLASHIGVLFNKPSIGVTRKALFGNYSIVSNKRSHSKLTHPRNKTTLGYSITLDAEDKPFFISPGHQITTQQSLDLIKLISCESDFLPNPIRIVHGRANRLAIDHWRNVRKSKLPLKR